MNAEMINTVPQPSIRAGVRGFFARNKRRPLSDEDRTILATLEDLKADLDLIHRTLDVVTDPILIDSFIYEMNAKNVRYKYFLNLCKEKGLIGELF
ncbi:MAG: YaaL family protein [Defluviitaleaceae bacterium]|nr:YaaL family protein [Defluviitaleaceae bacterium]